MKIVFPEYQHPIIRQAASITGVEMIENKDLSSACEMVREGRAETMVAGIEYTSREVILACKNVLGMKDKTFSASFVMEKADEKYVMGDAAACKQPTVEQLFEITLQTYKTAKAVLEEEPRVAMLSFSTLGSGGRDESIEKIKTVVEKIRRENPKMKIEGELQLDAAVNLRIGQKKAPNSLVAGQANVLICPDLNSGNILYKAMEQFGGFVAAGPILQGFLVPISDLSRGSTVEDVVAVIETLKKLVKNKEQ